MLTKRPTGAVSGQVAVSVAVQVWFYFGASSLVSARPTAPPAQSLVAFRAGTQSTHRAHHLNNKTKSRLLN